MARMTTDRMERKYGFGLRRTDNGRGWIATSADVEGYGKTRIDAINDALRERRGQREDADRMDQEAGLVRGSVVEADPMGYSPHDIVTV